MWRNMMRQVAQYIGRVRIECFDAWHDTHVILWTRPYWEQKKHVHVWYEGRKETSLETVELFHTIEIGCHDTWYRLTKCIHKGWFTIRHKTTRLQYLLPYNIVGWKGNTLINLLLVSLHFTRGKQTTNQQCIYSHKFKSTCSYSCRNYWPVPYTWII